MTDSYDYKKAIACVNSVMAEKEKDRRNIWTFEEFLEIVRNNPSVLRNIHSLFRDTILDNVERIPDKYPDDPDSIDYTGWDCSKLLVEGHQQPFFTSILLSHVFVEEMMNLGKSAKQNKIYKVCGPPGSGKSTFFKNLLNSFTREAHKRARFETIWVIEEELIEEIRKKVYILPVNGCDSSGKDKEEPMVGRIEVPCPSHCNPFQSLPVTLPENYRAMFLDKVITDSELKNKIFNNSEYRWMWMRSCHICNAMFWALYDKFDNDLVKVLSCLRVRRYSVDRQIGKGISVFRSSDESSKARVLTNKKLQERLNDLFGDSDLVRYRYSPWSSVDDGVVVLEDVKAHNSERLKELHNKVSEGTHKVGEDFEEDLDCLYFIAINPEDEKEIDSMSMSDRILEIYIPYDTDVPTEVDIYRSIFGEDFDKDFMPELSKYFAKVILVSRMPETGKVVKLFEWISQAEIGAHYGDYCDKEGKLLMMALAKAKVPPWIKEEHQKKFKKKLRRKIIEELAKLAGRTGYTGRDSIDLMSDFIKKMNQQTEKSKAKDRLYIPDFNDMLRHFKTQPGSVRDIMIPKGFLDQLEKTYDSKQLQRVKSALYYFNPKQIATEVQNYIYGVTQKQKTKVFCKWTGEELELTDEFFKSIEMRIHDMYPNPSNAQRTTFRNRVAKEYAEKTFTDEMQLQGLPITETELYLRLYKDYANNLKDRVLDPWIDNESFRRAVVDYGEADFESGYDKKIKEAIEYLLVNFQKEEYGSHTLAQAKKTVLSVLDKEKQKKNLKKE